MERKYYYIGNPSADILIKTAAKLFSEYTTHKQDPLALAQTLNKLTTAISLCRSQYVRDDRIESDTTDLAFALRKFASVKIRDREDKNYLTKTKEALEEALKLFDSTTTNSDVIIVEKQRCLHQLRHIAYELKDGILLHNTINTFLVFLKEFANKDYMIDCYESLFHLAFANGNYEKALDYADQAINLCAPVNSQQLDTAKISFLQSQDEKSVIYFRLKSKTYLAQLESVHTKWSKPEQESYLTNTVEKTFWKAYDSHKEFLKKTINFGLSSEKWQKKLLKDLVHLSSIRCKRSLLDCDNGISPVDYVLKEGRKVFRNSKKYCEILENTLNDKVAFILANHYLPLDYQFFAQKTPPCINFSAEKIAEIFPSKTNTNLFDWA